MTADDGFGAALERLAVGKRIDLAAAVQPAGARREVEDVLLRGTSPGPSLLRVLAPVLGWHAADVFALAAVPVPDDLGPTGRLTGRWVTDVIRSFVVLGPERQADVLRFAESLTGEEPTASVRMPASMAYPPGPGGIVMRLAWNRRLDWIATAKTLALTADRYLSAATYGGVGHGQVSLSSELLGEFSTLLDIPAPDLAAVTGIAFPDLTAERLPASRRVGDLIWKVRCLSVRQLSQVTAVADALAPREP